jgi:hypothetical protein
VPESAYQWAFADSLFFSLLWWASFCYILYAEATKGGTLGFESYVLVVPTLLGAASGLVGFVALPRPWPGISLLLGFVCVLPALALASLVMCARLR